MRTRPNHFGRSTLVALMLAPVLGSAAPRMNPADMAVPLPTAPQAPPAHVEPALPGPGMPLPAPSSTSSGGLPQTGESGGDAVEVRKLPNDVGQHGMQQDAARQATGATPHSENGVRWMCGGIGLDESSRMKQDARNYAMMLSFSARDGSYLADVKVRVVDSHGKPVLDTTCDGPILLLNPPGAGTYRITAQSGGTTVTRTAAIASGQHGKSIAMVWPDRPARSDVDVVEPAAPSAPVTR
jgi:hypothetical protein